MAETHWKQNFNYKYTGAYELKSGETKTLTIKRTCSEEVASEKGRIDSCFVAYFENQTKPMILNKTNCKTIEKLYGPIIENWIGKKIVVESQRVKYKGDMVDALRVKHVQPKQEQLANIDSARAALEACQTLDDLKRVYLSLSKEEQFATISIKDEIKSRLEVVK
jgi:hypothetical protein